MQGLFYFCHGGRPFVVGCRKGTSSAPSCASTRGASAQRLLAAWPFCLRSELDTLFRHDKTNHPRRAAALDSEPVCRDSKDPKLC